MGEAQQVIPYAGTLSPRAGLTPGTILAVFALLYAPVEYLNNAHLAETLARATDMPSPTGMMLVTQHLHVASIGCLLAGATLLFARRPLGNLVVAGAVAFRVGVVAPLLLGVLYSSDMYRRLPPAQLIGTAAISMLTWAAEAVWRWLVCRLAVESRRALGFGGPDWAAIQRTCTWSILLYGVCRGLALAIASLRYGTNPQAIWWPYAAPESAAVALLVIGGVGGVLRQRWAWWLCITAAAAWALRPTVTSLLQQRDLVSLWFMLRRIDSDWFAHNLAGVPLVVLWMMVLCHPQVRGQWAASDSG